MAIVLFRPRDSKAKADGSNSDGFIGSRAKYVGLVSLWQGVDDDVRALTVGRHPPCMVLAATRSSASKYHTHGNCYKLAHATSYSARPLAEVLSWGFTRCDNCLTHDQLRCGGWVMPLWIFMNRIRNGQVHFRQEIVPVRHEVAASASADGAYSALAALPAPKRARLQDTTQPNITPVPEPVPFCRRPRVEKAPLVRRGDGDDEYSCGNKDCCTCCRCVCVCCIRRRG